MKLRTTAILATIVSATTLGTFIGSSIAVAQTQQQSGQSGSMKNDTVLNNPTMMRELLKKRDMRDQIMNDKEMMRKALQNDEVRQEMLTYPDIQVYLQRNPDLKGMLSEKEQKQLEKAK